MNARAAGLAGLRLLLSVGSMLISVLYQAVKALSQPRLRQNQNFLYDRGHELANTRDGGRGAGSSRESHSALLTRYADELACQLQCFDRVILQGTLIDVAHPAALSSRLHEAGLMLSDLMAFATPLRDEICAQAERLAQ